MKFIFIILLILLLLNISCKYVIGKDEEITIEDRLDTGIVYVNLYNFSDTEPVYVTLEVDKGGIDEYIEAKFSDTQTVDPGNFTNYYYTGYSKTVTSTTYYYQINYKKYNFMIFKYHLDFRWGTPNYLKVKVTDKNPSSKIFLIIIIITVGGFIAVIGAIVGFIYKKKKEQKKDVNTDGVPNVINPSLSVASQESFVNNNNDNQQHFPKYPESY